MNLYWAHEHYDELARIRGGQGLDARASTPTFLISVHKHALEERALRGGDALNKVRNIARRVMRGTLRSYRNQVSVPQITEPGAGV
jgi:hypothetical protein